MKTLIFIVLLLALTTQPCFPQEFEETENWIGEFALYQTPFLVHRLKNFTKDDVAKAKEKLNLIKSSSSQSEWDGVFVKSADLSDIRLIWKEDAGFIDYYIYTCAIELRNLNYGRVINSPDFVNLVSEKPAIATKQKDPLTGVKLIKVRVGERRFLVPEDELADFYAYAVGLSLNEYESQSNYWWKLSDSKKPLFGLPILPDKFKRFLRYPIKAKIAKIGKQEVIESKNADGKLEKDFVNYDFTINAGTNKGVRKGMKLYIPEMQEWAQVERVSLTSSHVFIQRFIGYGEKEVCTNETSEEHDCGNLAVGMTAQTQNNYL